MSLSFALLLLQIMGVKMPDANIDSIKGPFGLKDEQFWNKPLWQQPAVDFRVSLGDALRDGMFLDTPDRVYGDRHESIPIAMIRSGRTDKLFDYNLRTTTRLVLSHLETGNIQIVKVAEPGSPKKRPASPGWASTELEVDLRQIAELGPGLGAYQAMLLCGPDSSNPKAFALFPSPSLEKDKATLIALEKLRREGGPPIRMADRVALDLRRAEPKAGTKEADFWEASLQRTPKGDMRLSLDFSLPVLPRFLLPPDRLAINPDGSKVRAVLPVYLAGFDADRSLCLSVFLGLPVEDGPSGTLERPRLASALDFSLSSLLGKTPPKGTLTLWVLAMDRAALVSVEMSKQAGPP